MQQEGTSLEGWAAALARRRGCAGALQCASRRQCNMRALALRAGRRRLHFMKSLFVLDFIIMHHYLVRDLVQTCRNDGPFCDPGDESVKAANAARFRERCQREFEGFARERLAAGELACRKLINAAQQHLTQARAASRLHSLPIKPS